MRLNRLLVGIAVGAAAVALVFAPPAMESRVEGATGLAHQLPQPLPSDTVCVGYRHCIRAAEPAALAARDDVRRDSLRLIFSVKNRPPLELVNGDPTQVDSHYYLYNGWDADLRAHRVYLMEYESSAVLYVFPSSGALSGLDNLPTVSPNRRYVADANADLYAQMEPNRARLFRILPDSLLLEWEVEPKLWGPDSLRWRDDTTLVIWRGPSERHPNPSSLAAPLVVQRRNGMWRVDSTSRAP